MLEAVKLHRDVLEYADKTLRKDKELLVEAVK